ncbi:TldD protein [Legionella hackeliae]|nr:TldD protein [Legionella hackeliae]
MTQALALAKDLLLKPASLDESTLERLIRSMMSHHVDDADLYFQSTSYESWYLEDSEVKSGSYSIDRGVGIRAVSGDKTGYAYCDDILLPAMQRAADAARSIAFTGAKVAQAIQVGGKPVARYAPLNPIEGMSKQEKIALLEAIDKEARRLDSRVIQVNASLSGCYEVVMVAGLNGQMMADIRPLVSIHVSVIVEDKNGRRESARSEAEDVLPILIFLKKKERWSMPVRQFVKP